MSSLRRARAPLPRAPSANPPGEVLRQIYLEPLNLTVSAAAAALGVTRPMLSRIINGHSGVSADMARRLSAAFGTTAEFWTNMQTAWELAESGRRLRRKKVTVLRDHDGLKQGDRVAVCS